MACALAPELRFARERNGVRIVPCGVGPVEAAAAVARELALRPYAAVVNAGIAGAFRPHAAVGDALVVTRETLAGLGLEGGEPLILPGGATLVDTQPADPDLARRCADLPLGTGLTVAQVTTTDETARDLAARYGAHVESMEGFSVLRAAALAGVPALEVRGISNYVGARASSAWNFEAGARAAARALDAVLDRLI